jgi:flagellar hook-length control protein FliK
MAQVNVLSLNLGQVSDTKVLGDGAMASSSQSGSEQSSGFSKVMAKHLDDTNGGKVATNSSSTTTQTIATRIDPSNTPPVNKQDTNAEQASLSHEQTAMADELNESPVTQTLSASPDAAVLTQERALIDAQSQQTLASNKDGQNLLHLLSVMQHADTTLVTKMNSVADVKPEVVVADTEITVTSVKIHDLALEQPKAITQFAAQQVLEAEVADAIDSKASAQIAASSAQQRLATNNQVLPTQPVIPVTIDGALIASGDAEQAKNDSNEQELSQLIVKGTTTRGRQTQLDGPTEKGNHPINDPKPVPVPEQKFNVTAAKGSDALLANEQVDEQIQLSSTQVLNASGKQPVTNAAQALETQIQQLLNKDNKQPAQHSSSAAESLASARKITSEQVDLTVVEQENSKTMQTNATNVSQKVSEMVSEMVSQKPTVTADGKTTQTSINLSMSTAAKTTSDGQAADANGEGKQQSQNFSNSTEPLTTERLTNAQAKPEPNNEAKVSHGLFSNLVANAQAQINDDNEQQQMLSAINNKVTEHNMQLQKQDVVALREAITLQHKDFANEVKDKVLIMIQHKIQRADIRLDPPELGSMQIKVQMQNEQAVVSFIVQNQQAKEVLEQNMARFKEALAESGVDVGDANVEHQDAQSGEQTANEKETGQSTTELASNELESQAQHLTAELVKGSAVGVDYYV